ncbi:MAG: acyltransferase [bacterium]|nr:acyltransferase [bacterium]
MTILRAAMTETRNAFSDMPETTADLGLLAGRMDEVRTANVTHLVELARDAAKLGAQIVCFGELCTAPYFALGEDELWFALAEDALEGPTVQAMRAAAREHGVILVVPIYEQTPRGRFNTAVVIDEGGDVLGRFRKVHIPRGENERAGFHETFYYGPSDGRLGNGPADVSKNPYFPVFDTSVGRIGIAICYDRHFPGSVRTLAANGAQLVFSPAVTFGAQSRRMWELEFLVDAGRHRVFVGGSNRSGAEHPWDVEYFGASYFCGPHGRVDPLADTRELVIADLDLDELSGADSSGWDLARDARPDVYSR